MARPVESVPGRHRAVWEGPRDTGRLTRLVRGDRGDDHALSTADGGLVRVGRHRGPGQGPGRHGFVRFPRLHAGPVGVDRGPGGLAIYLLLQAVHETVGA